MNQLQVKLIAARITTSESSTEALQGLELTLRSQRRLLVRRALDFH